MEKKSIINRIISLIKKSPLFDIFVDKDAGLVADSQDKQVDQLASNSNISSEELARIQAEFNKSTFSIEAMEKDVSKVPDDTKSDHDNPYYVEGAEKIRYTGRRVTPQSHEKGIEKEIIDD